MKIEGQDRIKQGVAEVIGKAIAIEVLSSAVGEFGAYRELEVPQLDFQSDIKMLLTAFRDRFTSGLPAQLLLGDAVDPDSVVAWFGEAEFITDILSYALQHLHRTPTPERVKTAWREHFEALITLLAEEGPDALLEQRFDTGGGVGVAEPGELGEEEADWGAFPRGPQPGAGAPSPITRQRHPDVDENIRRKLTRSAYEYIRVYVRKATSNDVATQSEETQAAAREGFEAWKNMIMLRDHPSDPDYQRAKALARVDIPLAQRERYFEFVETDLRNTWNMDLANPGGEKVDTSQLSETVYSPSDAILDLMWEGGRYRDVSELSPSELTKLERLRKMMAQKKVALSQKVADKEQEETVESLQELVTKLVADVPDSVRTAAEALKEKVAKTSSIERPITLMEDLLHHAVWTSGYRRMVLSALNADQETRITLAKLTTEPVMVSSLEDFQRLGGDSRGLVESLSDYMKREARGNLETFTRVMTESMRRVTPRFLSQFSKRGSLCVPTDSFREDLLKALIPTATQFSEFLEVGEESLREAVASCNSKLHYVHSIPEDRDLVVAITQISSDITGPNRTAMQKKRRLASRVLPKRQMQMRPHRSMPRRRGNFPRRRAQAAPPAVAPAATPPVMSPLEQPPVSEEQVQQINQSIEEPVPGQSMPGDQPQSNVEVTPEAESTNREDVVRQTLVSLGHTVDSAVDSIYQMKLTEEQRGELLAKIMTTITDTCGDVTETRVKSIGGDLFGEEA